MESMAGESASHLAAIVRSMDAGFRFLHLRDSAGVAAIHAERWRAGAVDTYTFRAVGEAIAARFRAEDYNGCRAQPLWQRGGSVAEVIDELMALPPHGSRGAPVLATRKSRALWLPGDGV